MVLRAESGLFFFKKHCSVWIEILLFGIITLFNGLLYPNESGLIRVLYLCMVIIIGEYSERIWFTANTMLVNYTCWSIMLILLVFVAEIWGKGKLHAHYSGYTDNVCTGVVLMK